MKSIAFTEKEQDFLQQEFIFWQQTMPDVQSSVVESSMVQDLLTKIRARTLATLISDEENEFLESYLEREKDYDWRVQYSLRGMFYVKSILQKLRVAPDV